MTDTEELLAAVRARTEGTPYVVTETARGFDLHIDLQDRRWSTLLYQRQQSETWIYHVRFGQGVKTLSITDDVRALSWDTGVGVRDGVPTPVASVATSAALGRFSSKRVQVTWSPKGHGGYDKSVDLDVTSEQGRDLIRGPAQELGWTEQRGVPERIGRYVGVGTLVLLVLAGVIVAIVALGGGF